MFNLLTLLTSPTKGMNKFSIPDQPSPSPKLTPNLPQYEVKGEISVDHQPEKEKKKKESCVDILFYANMMRYHCTREGKIQDFQHRELQDLDCPSKFFDRFVEMKKAQLPREEYLRYQQMCQVYGEDYFEKRSSM